MCCKSYWHEGMSILIEVVGIKKHLFKSRTLEAELNVIICYKFLTQRRPLLACNSTSYLTISEYAEGKSNIYFDELIANYANLIKCVVEFLSLTS